MIRVLVADDHPVVRTGLGGILVRRCDITMLGEAGTSAEVRQLVAQKPWDVVVLDLSLPDLSGLELVKELKRARPRLPILILGVYPEEEFAVRAIRAGAAGYISKGGERVELGLAGTRQAAGGQTERMATGRGPHVCS